MRFGESERSLRSVVAHTDRPIVVVDAGSPKRTRRFLAAMAEEHGLTYVRTDHMLLPNEARNLGAELVDTEYVCFVDNDVSVTPGWIEALERCADETGADVVGPITGIGTSPATERVHWFTGPCHVVEQDGRRVLVTTHEEGSLTIEQARALPRQETELVEFHTLFARMARLREVGMLDESLNTREHCDLCLSVRAAGGSVWVEPESVIVYVVPRRVALRDVPMFVNRWRADVNEHSLETFRARWDLPVDDPFLSKHTRFLHRNRQRGYEGVGHAIAKLPEPARRQAQRVWGRGMPVVDKAVQQAIATNERRLRRRAGWSNRHLHPTR
jgi:glycosyltransferase involved in cell wall biosynthesis